MTLTHEAIAPYVESGLVSAREFDGLVIYNYTDRCTYQRAWDDVTIRCRGLVMPVGEDVALTNPFPKFFNHGEPDAQIPLRAPDLVSDKRDGSLAISYMHRGRVRWTTRGSMTSEQAQIAERVWDASYADVAIPDGVTLLCEVESPEIDSIIKAPCDRLVLLGMRRIGSDVEIAWDECVSWAESVGMPVSESFTLNLEECIERAKTLPPDHEGWVLRWDSEGGTYRVKVKGAEYLAIARFIKSMGPRSQMDAWYYNRLDLIERVPEEFSTEVLETWREADAIAESLEIRALESYERVQMMPRKDAVRDIGTKSDHFPLVMNLLDGKDPDYRMAAYRLKTGERYPRDVFSGVDDV